MAELATGLVADEPGIPGRAVPQQSGQVQPNLGALGRQLGF
jgi:hypothetical protein